MIIPKLKILKLFGVASLPVLSMLPFSIGVDSSRKENTKLTAEQQSPVSSIWTYILILSYGNKKTKKKTKKKKKKKTDYGQP